jgi:hypothetical protein
VRRSFENKGVREMYYCEKYEASEQFKILGYS